MHGLGGLALALDVAEWIGGWAGGRGALEAACRHSRDLKNRHGVAICTCEGCQIHASDVAAPFEMQRVSPVLGWVVFHQAMAMHIDRRDDA